jgi:selenocysteine lyase/cysteine desulfurase
MLENLSGPGLAFFDKGATINWEPGTQNHEAIYAFGGTLQYFDDLATKLNLQGSRRERWQQLYDAFHAHETALLEQLLQGLDTLGITRYGLPGAAGRAATVSINVRDLKARTVAEHLGKRGIAVADGHYYAHDLMMKTLKLGARDGAVRISLLHYNNQDDVEAVLEALAEL